MLGIGKLAEAPPSLLISRVFGPLPGGTELCVWNGRTRDGEEMSFLTSGPNRNFHCDSELPGQNRKTDLCGSRELLTTWNLVQVRQEVSHLAVPVCLVSTSVIPSLFSLLGASAC